MSLYLFYIDKNGEQQGPINENVFVALRQKRIISKWTLVWYYGMSEWLPASQIPLTTEKEDSIQLPSQNPKIKILPQLITPTIENKNIYLYKYYFDAWKKYAVFTGRASRKQFWMFVLFSVLISIISLILPPISFLYQIAIYIPSLAISVRRIHDVNKGRGWTVCMVLIFFICLILDIVDFIKEIFGMNPDISDMINMLFLISLIILFPFSIMLLIFCIRKGNSGENQYGADPKQLPNGNAA